MIDWIESLVLGLVQGLTEFLPISSDGHLAVTQLIFDAIKGHTTPDAARAFFFIVLHVGTTLAILLHYRQQVAAGLKGFLGSRDVAGPFRRSNVVRTGMLAVVATLPLIPDKLFFLKLINETFNSFTWIGAGFLVTAVALTLTNRLAGGDKGPRETTYYDALLIGVAQMFAPLPGVSRSGLTITAALALGLSKTWAVGFSLMMAVLAVSGATLDEMKDFLTADHPTPSAMTPAQMLAGTVVSGVVGYLAITWLVRLVRAGRFWYFSVYLVALGLGLIAFDQSRRSPTDARPTPAADRPAAGAAPVGGDRPGAGVGGPAVEPDARPLDRPVAPGA